jgi:glycosyltransferase involved in cell wall biosynthesis
MKKLLFIVNIDWFFISHRLPIALASIKKGFEVHIACAITDKKELLEYYGIIVHPLELSRSGVGVINELKTLRKIYTIIKSVKPDIAHGITIKPVLYGGIVARLLKVPVRVSSISGLGYVFIAQGLKAKILRFIVSVLYRSAMKNSKAIIFQNRSDSDILTKLGAVNAKQAVFIRGSGVDLTQYSATSEPVGDLVVMLVARLLVDKGVMEFVEAAKIIRLQRSDIRMVLVGDTDLYNPKSVSPVQIKKWVEKGIVEHWGYSHNVEKVIEKSNIMVLPSYREGLPKVLIEAAACGRAVVTTDVPGCRDAIEPNETGLLVDVKSAGSLVGGILKLTNDSDLRHKFAKNARKLAERAFNIDDVISIHLSIYTKK